MKIPITILHDKMEQILKLKIKWETTNKPIEILQELEQEEILELTYNNCLLSGNKLTKKQTIELNKGYQTKNLPFENVMESLRTHITTEEIFKKIKSTQIPINKKTLLEIHYDLTAQNNYKQAGKFRGTNLAPQNRYKTNTIPEEINNKIIEAFQNYNQKNYNQIEVEKNNIEKIVELQKELQVIRPFEDGNAKTFRMLQNICLIQNGYWAIEIPEENKYQYQYVIAIIKQGNTEIYYEFLLNKIINSGNKKITSLNNKLTIKKLKLNELTPNKTELENFANLAHQF
jgi:fido (protein-threonine AMPylation protein)